MSSASMLSSAVRLRHDTTASSIKHHHNPRRVSSKAKKPNTLAQQPHRRATLTRRRTGAAAAAGSAAGSLEAQQAEYTRWRDGKGIKSPNVEVAYFGEVDIEVMRYRGVKASAKVGEGDVLVELPRESCLVLMDDAKVGGACTAVESS
jgi:hypothetical protein